jgi:uncharacterized SAM-binding protein YcdF (DUF218 family)
MQSERTGSVLRRFAAAAGLAAALGPSLWPAATLSQEIYGRPPAVRVDTPETLTGIVALGGGEERMLEAGRLARLYPHLRVVVSGESNDHLLWRRLGPSIDPARVLVESASRNTRENAVNAAALVKPRPGERWLLITSPWHMPRATCAFAAVGFPVEPWPIIHPGDLNRPQDTAKASEERAITAYKLLGWCSAQLRGGGGRAQGAAP